MAPSEVRALLFGFQNSDLKEDIEEMQQQFEKIDRWHVTTHFLSDTNSEIAEENFAAALSTSISEARTGKGIETLVVYYGGHAVKVQEPNKLQSTLKWHAKSQQTVCSEHVVGVKPWDYLLTTVLSDAYKNVLILLHCPHDPAWPDDAFMTRDDLRLKGINRQLIAIPEPLTGTVSADDKWCIQPGCLSRMIIDTPQTQEIANVQARNMPEKCPDRKRKSFFNRMSLTPGVLTPAAPITDETDDTDNTDDIAGLPAHISSDNDGVAQQPDHPPSVDQGFHI